MTTAAAGSDREWWGSVEIDVGSTLAWYIGPLRLQISHNLGEWRVAYQPGEGPAEDRVELAKACNPETAAQRGGSIERFAMDSMSNWLGLVPLTADRTVVSHPTEPFYVPPGQETRLFVSSPLWVGVEHDGTRLCEVPITRPSDTWIGSTTGDGELAYSSRTFCRLRIEDVPFRPHRAVTPVVVANHSNSNLALERISIAVPSLSLYRGAGAILWTEEVRLTYGEDGDEVEMEISDRAPSEVGGGECIRDPREFGSHDRVRRALDVFF